MKKTNVISDIQKALEKESRILGCYIFGSYAKDENYANDFEA